MQIVESDVKAFLFKLGENPSREGLEETPSRVLKSLSDLFSGYYRKKGYLNSIFKEFETKNNSMVVETRIPVYSFCEHHILPFFGTCNIGYIPDGKVVGASKLIRVVDFFARKLQIQENLTEQIANCIMDKLCCKGVMITMRCLHLCMIYRGVKSQNTSLITSTVLGCFKEEPIVREEFMDLTGGVPELL